MSRSVKIAKALAVKVTGAGALPVVADTVSVPVTELAGASGVKRTRMLQLAPAMSVVPHSPAAGVGSEKPDPVTVLAIPAGAWVPLLDSVNTRSLLVPTPTLPKAPGDGDRASTAGVKLEPANASVGLPPGFPLTVRVAIFDPGGATGVITTVSVHVPAAASVFPLQVSVTAVIANSVEPVMAVASVPVTAPPLFVTVKVCPALGVPCATGPKGWGAGVIARVAAVTAVPARVAETEFPGLAVRVSVPALAPMVVGWNTTPIMQVKVGCSVAQLLDAMPNCVESVPPMIAVMVPEATPPMLVTVNVWVTRLVAPAAVPAGNVNAVGLTVRTAFDSPTPLRAADEELPDALSLTVSVAVFAPGGATGVITTVIVQVPVSAARIFPLQPSAVSAKSVAGVMLVASAAVATPPVLVTVNVCEPLGMPWTTEPNACVSGVIATELGGMPLPVGAGASVAVPPVAALTETAPVRTTAIEGLNWTRTTQDAAGASNGVLAQSPLTAGVAGAKSAPVTLTVSGVEVACSPLFTTTNVSSMVLLTKIEPKSLVDPEAGLIVSLAGASAVPARVAEGEPPGLAVTFNAPALAPKVNGLKTTPIVQEPPAATVVQVVDAMPN
jgi:hypothetical protein